MNPSKNTPKVTTIIVTFNGEKWINRCINSLHESNYKTEIIIVDNHSADGTLEIIKSYNDIQLIQEDKNHGFGIANNIGISNALKQNADYLFLLNQDAFISNNTISNLVDSAEKNPSFGLYSPIHLDENGEDFDENFLKNYVIDSAPQYLSDLCIKGKARSIYPIYSVNAAAWFIRSKTFEVAGGFDPIFFMYGEDNDFSNRLEYHGIKRALVTNSFVQHSRGKHPQKRNNALLSIHLRANRIRSNTLAKIKNPNRKLFINTISCLVNILFASINELFYNLDLKEFLSHLLAIFYLIFEIKKIAEHREICMNEERPWLDQIPSVDTNQK